MKLRKLVGMWSRRLHVFVWKHKGLFRFQRQIRGYGLNVSWMWKIHLVIKYRWIYEVFVLLSVPFGYLKSKFQFKGLEEPEDGLMIVAIAKNEGRYLREWIDFYLSSGVDKIAIYDNGSSDDTAQIARSYGEAVDCYSLPGSVRQMDAYNMALNRYRTQFRYMAMLDCDEYLYCAGDLYTIIDELFHAGGRGDIGGLAVNWLSFGSSGHIQRPEGGVLENYLWRARENRNINLSTKMICMPIRTLAYVMPHYAAFRKGYCSVNENGEETFGPKTESVSTKRIRINHYFTKSREDWMEKVERGRATTRHKRDLNSFSAHDWRDEFDDRILHYVASLHRLDGIGGENEQKA